MKLAKKRGLNITKLKEVLELLARGINLPQKYRDHNLIENYKRKRECHIAPVWLLIYEICDDALILMLIRTGTHSDLF